MNSKNFALYARINVRYSKIWLIRSNVNKFITKNENLFVISALIILYKSILEFSYIFTVVPYFEYAGFLLSFSIEKYVEGLFLIGVALLLLPQTIIRPSELIIFIFFILIFVPIVAYYALADLPRSHFYCLAIQYFIVQIYIRSNKEKLNVVRQYKFSNQKFLYNLSLCFTLFTVVFLFFTIGPSGLNFDLTRVYDFRSENTEMISVGIMPYLVSWSVKIFNLFLIVWNLMRRKFKNVLFFISIQLLFFGFLNHKTVLFYPIILLGLYFLMQLKRKIIFLLITINVLLVVIITYSIVQEDVFISSLLIRRIFFIPPYLNFVYYEFFSKSAHVYLSSSILSGVIEYPYKLSTVFVIGEYLGDPKLAANAGFLATSYMHFGYVGIVLFPLIVGWLIRRVDQFSTNIPFWLSTGIIILPFINLFMSSDLPITVLTHGLGVGLLFLGIINGSFNINHSNKRIKAGI